ncbi:MAG: hypothetical protein Kow00121_31380 [Elainellaceae cyanobacterium]
MSYDLPIWSVVETDATLYQKDQEQFHVLLTEPHVQEPHTQQIQGQGGQSVSTTLFPQTPRLLWLEISPYRVILTMQGNGQFSYRHFWEQGVYGLSRYWLQTNSLTQSYQLRLRNFTRSLTLTGHSFPQQLRVEYELWAQPLQLGHYVMNLEILN